MWFSRYVVDNKSHYFASERSRNCVSFAHGYSSNILSGLSDLLFPSKLGKAPQSAQRLLSELLSGDGEIRTLDPLLARQVLSQLSYTPTDAVPSSIVSLYLLFLLDGLALAFANGLEWTRTTDLTLIRRAL